MYAVIGKIMFILGKRYMFIIVIANKKNTGKEKNMVKIGTGSNMLWELFFLFRF